MQVITSSANQIIKDAAAHKSGKSCFALLEGENLVNEAINRRIKIEKLFLLKDREREYGTILERLLSQNKCENFAYLVSENVLKTLSDTKTPQGIVALIELRQNSVSEPKSNFLVLDNLQDPGNLGAILRSAVGAGFSDIYLLGCVSITNPKVIRSSMGAVLSLGLYQTKTDELKNILKKTGVPLFKTDMQGRDIFSFNPPPLFGLAIGNEGKGISEEVKKLCSDTLTIPMKGDLESLNAAVAASIIMFTLINQR